MRAAEEQRSREVFAELTRLAPMLGVAEVLRSRLAEATEDEARHRELCAALAADFGAGRPPYDLTPVHQRFSQAPTERLRYFSLALVEVAIGETVSCALFGKAARNCEEPRSKATLLSILRDEAGHAELGWAALDDARRLWTGEERDWLVRSLTGALRSLEAQTALPALRWLEAGKAFDPAWARLGVVHPEERVEAFYRALELQVLPRLDRLQLDGSQAWAAGHQAPTP